jgi:hypothetical protein
MTQFLPGTVLGLAVLGGCASTGGPRPFPEDAWRGLHIYIADRAELPLLHRAIEEVLVPKGMNTLVFEVDYQFAYRSHPEVVESNPMTYEDARDLTALCRRLGVRLIPQFQCFGHQGSRPIGLLKAYPELMAPPNPDYNARDHYHVSWNPLDPKTNEIVFDLFDELIEVFEPDAFHVGMDEVFLFPDETTPHYNGESNAEMFAKAVNDYHDYLVKEKGLTMLMWGDRLLDKEETGYHSFESSANGTAPAIDAIPTDIIICDWHYMRRPDYPSVRQFQERGFRVWPSGWKSPTASMAFIEIAQRDDQGLVIGHLCTTWCGAASFCKAVLGEDLENVNEHAIRAAKTFFAVADIWMGKG